MFQATTFSPPVPLQRARGVISNRRSISTDVSTIFFGIGMSFHFSGLILVVHAGVPKADNVDGVVLDAIDQLVQAIDDNAAVSLRAVFEERVKFTDSRAALQQVGCVAHLLFELVFALDSTV